MEWAAEDFLAPWIPGEGGNRSTGNLPSGGGQGGGAIVTIFPICDADGNNVASATRSGTGWSVNDRRSYDAWGVVRAQQSAGDPKLRYCASPGHKQDDETGLIYMRARYYEPTTGRFISQDTEKKRSGRSQRGPGRPVGPNDNVG